MITKNIKRILFDILEKRLFTGKTILVLGSRQTGKTTLLKEILKSKTNSKNTVELIRLAMVEGWI